MRGRIKSAIDGWFSPAGTNDEIDGLIYLGAVVLLILAAIIVLKILKVI